MASSPVKPPSNHAEKKQAFDISEQALDISHSLTRIISQRIKEKNNEISFSEFMQMALYEPQLGYYQNNLKKFGEQGDFVTAPEMGQFFATCLANSLSGNSVNGSTDSSEGSDRLLDFEMGSILEIGAGSGRLACHLLIALTESSSQPDKYYILEPSAALQAQQRELLAKEIPDYFQNICWLQQMPESFDGVIIANEVIDALPFDRIIKQSDSWYQLNVSCSGNGFAERLGEKIADHTLPDCLHDRSVYPQGYQAEIRPMASGWIAALAASLERGVIILLDYGYPQQELYHAQRAAGSLKCFISHHQHDDPFQHVGLQDITAHVDFTEIAVSAHENELAVSGFTTQAGFLLENGITELAETKKGDLSTAESKKQAYSNSRELQQLLMPGQMGEIVKVMLLKKNTDRAIKGFSLQDHLHRL